MSEDWYPGRVTQAKGIFQYKAGAIGLQLGRARQTYGRLPLRSRPYRMLAVGPGAIGPPSVTSTFSRLSRSWAELGIAWPISHVQSDMPKAISRPRRNRHSSPP